MNVINVESNRLPAIALYIVVAGDLITGNGSDCGWKKKLVGDGVQDQVEMEGNIVC